MNLYGTPAVLPKDPPSFASDRYSYMAILTLNRSSSLTSNLTQHFWLLKTPS